MSADNWTVCPRCQKAEEARRELRRKQVEDSYGQVPAAEYLAAVERLTLEEQDGIKETLREDYDVGIDDGVFSVDYRASCSECKYEFSYVYVVAANQIATEAGRTSKAKKKGR